MGFKSEREVVQNNCSDNRYCNNLLNVLWILPNNDRAVKVHRTKLQLSMAVGWTVDKGEHSRKCGICALVGLWIFGADRWRKSNIKRRRKCKGSNKLFYGKVCTDSANKH